MIVLDTNVVAAMMKEAPEAPVLNWLNHQDWDAIWITSITVLESVFGVQIMAGGQHQGRLRAAFEKMVGASLAGRVLGFDERAARETAELMAQRRRIGQTIDLRDAMIAGIVRSTGGGILATRNIGHFEATGIRLIDPWAVA